MAKKWKTTDPFLIKKWQDSNPEVDFSRLQATLVNSKLQTENPALYQTIAEIIRRLGQFQQNNIELLIEINGKINDFTDNIFINGTVLKLLSQIEFLLGEPVQPDPAFEPLLPNARELLPGTNISFDDSIANQRTVNSTGVPVTTSNIGIGGILALDGEDGEDGFSIIGATGPTGSTGPTGASGSSSTAVGPPGLDAEEAEYPYIIPGPIGSTGAAGAAGTIGIDGKPGPPGIDAEESEYPYVVPGPQGNTGTTGSTGPTGPIGLMGARGPEGLDGQDGYDGYPGPTGSTGSQGATGSTGPAGIQGTPGIPGIDAEEAEYPYLIPGPPGPVTLNVLKTTAPQTINAGAGTFVDITGLTFPVANGSIYCFKFYIVFQSANLNTGWRCSVNCPTGTLSHYATVQTVANAAAGAATWLHKHNTARDDMTLLTATVTAGVDLVVKIEGRYVCTQNGTFAARFANELNADTNVVVQSGSWGMWF